MTECRELLKRTALVLNEARIGTATAGAGNSTTLSDTDAVDVESDDYYNDGTIFIENDSDAMIATVITDFAQTDCKFTFATQARNIEAGDRYLAFTDDYTKDMLLRAVNSAINELPPIDGVDDTTLSTVADQEAYNYPTNGWIITKLEIATSTTSPYGWVEWNHWYPSNDGTNDTIKFLPGRIPTSSGYLMRVTYEVYPSEMTADTDVLSNWYDADWVAWEAAKHALSWRMASEEGQNQFIIAKHAEAEQKSMMYHAKHSKRVPRMLPRPILGGWSKL